MPAASGEEENGGGGDGTGRCDGLDNNAEAEGATEIFRAKKKNVRMGTSITKERQATRIQVINQGNYRTITP